MIAPVLAVSDVTKVYRMGEIEVEALRGIDVIGDMADRVLRLADGRVVSHSRSGRRVAPEELQW